MVEQAISSTQVKQAASKRYFISLRIKILLGFTLVFGVVFASAFYWFYTFATEQASNRIEQDMVDTLMGVAKTIDGDALVDLYKTGQARTDGYTDDERYWEHVRFLADVTEMEPRASLYTYVPGPEEYDIVYIGSSWAVRTPPEGVKFLEPYSSKGSSWKGLQATTLKLADDKGNFGYHDEYGYWISGRTPILNSAGEKVGAVGIDFKADYVLEVQQAILDKVFIAFLVTYAFLFLLAYLISITLTRPMQVLTRAAEKIGEGEYEQDLSGLTRGISYDEINKLAQVFTIMVDKVYQREVTLRRQVEELKIEIDEAKQQKQVSEIVDSDFFQSLQLKARQMRSRSAHNPQTSVDTLPTESV